jgi:cell wall-associated NlpC family hydrolase
MTHDDSSADVRPTAARRRRSAAGVLAAGVVIGGATAWAASAGASGSSSSPTPSAERAHGEHGSGGLESGRAGRALDLSGTVTDVAAKAVTIKTSSGTKTYSVDANSDVDKNGEAQLSDLKVGDVVHFSVTSGGAIDKLHAGSEALDRPSGRGRHDGRGGPAGPIRTTGTVAAVTAKTVTIKTSSGTKTYSVDANSDVDKNGEAQLSDLKVGDVVHFSVTSGGAIDKLHAD